MAKATETHSEYVIVIVFPWQKWLSEGSSILQYSTFPVLLNYLIRLLTFRHHASYIEDSRTATPQSTLFIYLVNKDI